MMEVATSASSQLVNPYYTAIGGPPSWRTYIRNYIDGCAVCAAYHIPLATPDPAKIGVSAKFERIGLDFIGPLPPNADGKRYILVATEYLAK